MEPPYTVTLLLEPTDSRLAAAEAVVLVLEDALAPLAPPL